MSLAPFLSQWERPLEKTSLDKASWELVTQRRARLKKKRIRKFMRWEGFLFMHPVLQRVQFKAEINRRRIHILI